MARIGLVFALLVLVALCAPASAAVYTWNNSGSLWETPGDWVQGSSYPQSADTAAFDFNTWGAAQAVTIDAAYTVSAMTLTGSGTLTLSGSNYLTVTNAITIGTGQTIGGSGQFYDAGGIVLNGGTLGTSGNSLTLAGTVSGTGTLAGTITATGNWGLNLTSGQTVTVTGTAANAAASTIGAGATVNGTGTYGSATTYLYGTLGSVGNTLNIGGNIYTENGSQLAGTLSFASGKFLYVYSGTVTENGTLTGSTSLRISTGATLTGTGMINAPIEFWTGGTLGPTTGTMTIGGNITFRGSSVGGVLNNVALSSGDAATIPTGAWLTVNGTVSGSTAWSDSGILNGTGTLNAPVTVASGGAIMPGSSTTGVTHTPGMLTLSGANSA